MRAFNKYVSVIMSLVVLCTMLFAGCDAKDKATSDTKKQKTEEVTAVKEKDYFKVETTISYSSGDTKNWSYGNQRKEFPANDFCYVRIQCKAFTDDRLGRGNGENIEVTYKFTGIDNCDIEISDGRVSPVESKDDNVVEYTRSLNVVKKSKIDSIAGDVVIFRYSPKADCEVSVDVDFDNQVNERFDQHNTIYFQYTENDPRSVIEQIKKGVV